LKTSHKSTMCTPPSLIVLAEIMLQSGVSAEPYHWKQTAPRPASRNGETIRADCFRRPDATYPCTGREDTKRWHVLTPSIETYFLYSGQPPVRSSTRANWRASLAQHVALTDVLQHADCQQPSGIAATTATTTTTADRRPAWSSRRHRRHVEHTTKTSRRFSFVHAWPRQPTAHHAQYAIADAPPSMLCSRAV
jgi:hypothetical protein